jgi:hypothetical protein
MISELIFTRGLEEFYLEVLCIIWSVMHYRTGITLNTNGGYMPTIPVNTPLGFIGLLMLVLGLFLLLAGFNILKVEKVTVKPGRLTWSFGIFLSIVGLLLLTFSEPILANKEVGLTETPPSPTVVTETNTAEPPYVSESPTITPTLDPATLLLAASSWPIVMQESFDSNDANWSVGKFENEYITYNKSVEDGKFIWNFRPKQDNVWYWEVSPLFAYKNFYLSVRTRRVPGADTYTDYGLLFKKQGNRVYTFRIDDKQYYTVDFYDDGTWTDFIGWTRISEINPTNVNILTLIVIEDEMNFFINNKHVGTVISNLVNDGNVGFTIGGDTGDQVTLEFDNFELREKP